MKASKVDHNEGEGNSALPVVVYTSDSILRDPRRVFSKMFDDLWSSRELAWRLFARDIRAQYRKSLLGYAWIVLPPLVTMLFWVIVKKQNFVNIGETDIAYPLYVLTGYVLWDSFVSALNGPIDMVARSRGMLAKVNFPHEALLVASFAQNLFNFFIRFLLLVIAFIWFGITLSWATLLAPLTVLALMILGFTIGLWLVPLSTLYSDVKRSIRVVTPIWFILTPVIYPSPNVWPFALINTLNPVSPLLVTSRDLLTKGSADNLLPVLLTATLSIIAMFLGWLVFKLAIPHIIARISS